MQTPLCREQPKTMFTNRKTSKVKASCHLRLQNMGFGKCM